MAAEPKTPIPGSRWIWPFEILEQIGEGGMGVVYRARYVVNGRNVALKMLPGDVTDKTALARFERELEVLKTLKHPNIVRCFGGVSEDKRRFYAMELVEGGSLEDKLQQKGKLRWEEVVSYGLQMCAALDCSHQKGVVHRDVKPGNFLLTPTGQIKLSDFGLASVAAARKITTAGKTAGTFLYMAPEQIRGQEVTPQTDLYALGCVLFELVTGRPPFCGETPAQTLHLHCHAAPERPCAIALDCPVALERIILKLLEKKPDDRPESAAVVAKELKSVSQSVTVVNRSPSLVSAAVKDDLPPTIETPIPRHLLEKSRGPGLPLWAQVILVLALAVSLAGHLIGISFARQDREWHRLWEQALNHPERQVRLVAVGAFSETSARSDASVNVLIDTLDDVDEMVRSASALGLSRAGERAKRAIPKLIKIQKEDPAVEVRAAADRALAVLATSETSSRFPWILSLVLLSLAIAGMVGWTTWRSANDQALKHSGGFRENAVRDRVF